MMSSSSTSGVHANVLTIWVEMPGRMRKVKRSRLLKRAALKSVFFGGSEASLPCPSSPPFKTSNVLAESSASSLACSPTASACFASPGFCPKNLLALKRAMMMLRYIVHIP